MRPINTLISTAIVAAGLLVGSNALAKKTITLKLHNQTADTRMTCRVHRVVTNTSGDDVDTLLRTFSVKPKNQRSSSVANRPQKFSLAMRYIARRIDRSVVYPRLKLTCELEGHNSENHTPLWDDSVKSFRRHRFYGGCRSYAYCSVRVERK
ncbi:MAG: hypothetical protein JKY37_08055 [Nannocystaceae bacterium]|nr:hypothetical protein [Nannocystaceae bacterium]